jgi:hypothetical protein
MSFESQIYLNNLLNLLRPRDQAEPGTSAEAGGRVQICRGFSGWQELLRCGHASGRELLRRGLTGGREQPRRGHTGQRKQLHRYLAGLH